VQAYESEETKKGSLLSVLTVKSIDSHGKEVISPLDVDGIYEDLRKTMIDVLVKIFDAKDNSEYVKQSGDWLIHKIEITAISRVQELLQKEETQMEDVKEEVKAIKNRNTVARQTANN